MPEEHDLEKLAKGGNGTRETFAVERVIMKAIFLLLSLLHRSTMVLPSQFFQGESLLWKRLGREIFQVGNKREAAFQNRPNFFPTEEK